MRKPEPRLQRKLLAWLLGPLSLLLVLDAAAAYWSSVRFSDLAYDRALHEIAREIVLHVKGDGAGVPHLELSPATENVLMMDQDDRLFFKLVSADGTLLGGDTALPDPPAALRPRTPPQFYGATLHGEPVRMVAAWMPVGDAPDG